MSIVGSFFCSGWNEGNGGQSMTCTIPFFYDYVDGFLGFFTIGSFLGPFFLLILAIPIFLAKLCVRAWPKVAVVDNTSGAPLLFIKTMYIACLFSLYVFFSGLGYLVVVLLLLIFTPYNELIALIVFPAFGYVFYKKSWQSTAFIHNQVTDVQPLPNPHIEEPVSAAAFPPVELDKELEAKNPNRNIVIIVVIGLVVGIVLAVVFTGLYINNSNQSLADARSKSSELIVKQSLISLPVEAELYANSSNQGYRGFCATEEVRKIMLDKVYVCNDNESSFAAAIETAEQEFYCVDSNLFSGNVNTPLGTGVSCSQVLQHTADSPSYETSSDTQPELSPHRSGWFFVFNDVIYGQNTKDGESVVSFNIVVEQSGWNVNLVNLQYGYSDLNPAAHLSMYRGVLYYIDLQGRLVHLNKDLLTVNMVPLELESGKVISDYFFKDDIVYYLENHPVM
jgi:hypothetical protein